MSLTDAPKSFIREDEFGLEMLARAVARNIVSGLEKDGYTISIQGRWGSGKTTLTNFIAEEVVQCSQDIRIIRFDPWLISNKSALIPLFLETLSRAVDASERARARWWHFWFWAKRLYRETLAEKIREYGEKAAVLSGASSAIAAYDVSGAVAAGTAGLRIASQLSKLERKSTTGVAAIKREITARLSDLSKLPSAPRFLAIIDDTDRLEPKEATEILRLVREVADFPLITYLVCFDEEILARQVRSSLRLQCGRDYLSKIFDQTITVPPQEPFALRRYLRKLLADAFPNELMEDDDTASNAGYRAHLLFDIWAGRLLETPRDVVRVFQKVSFGWPHLPRGSDFIDYVWLQMVQLKAPELHEWTQGYLASVGAYRDGGHASENESRNLAADLYNIMKKFGWHEKVYFSGLNEFLPGIAGFAGPANQREVFKFTANEISALESRRRLGSPTHWKQYFAFSLPSYAISDDDLQSFRQAVTEGRQYAIPVLRDILMRPHRIAGHFAGVLFERLSDLPPGSLSLKEQTGLLSTLGDLGDEMASATKELVKNGRSELWWKTITLLQHLDPSLFGEVAANGRAISWLAHVVRKQGFAHGRPDPGRANLGDEWLSVEQLDDAIEKLISRFRSQNLTALVECPSPLDVLFMWSQLGDRNEVRTAIENLSQSDDAFLKVVSVFRGWRNSSAGGISYPIRNSVVQGFMDSDRAYRRLETLAADEKVENLLRETARSLLRDWKRSDDD